MATRHGTNEPTVEIEQSPSHERELDRPHELSPALSPASSPVPSPSEGDTRSRERTQSVIHVRPPLIENDEREAQDAATSPETEALIQEPPSSTEPRQSTRSN